VRRTDAAQPSGKSLSAKDDDFQEFLRVFRYVVEELGEIFGECGGEVAVGDDG
jgi:hypothetical protein